MGKQLDDGIPRKEQSGTQFATQHTERLEHLQNIFPPLSGGKCQRPPETFMDVDGDYIIDRIRKEVDKDERLTKAIQKAKERAADS